MHLVARLCALVVSKKVVAMKRNIALLTFVVGAGAWLLADTRPWSPGVDRAQDGRARLDQAGPSRLFPGLTPGDFRSVEFYRGDLLLTVKPVERTTNDFVVHEWAIVSTPLIPVDQLTFKSVLSTLASISFEHHLDAFDYSSPESARQFGFDTVGFRLGFTAGGKDHSIEFGNRNQISGRRYVRIDGADAVYLVNDEAVAQLDRTLDALIIQHPIVFDSARVASVELRKPDGSSLILTKRAEGTWEGQSKSKSFSADADVVEELLQLVQASRAKSIKGSAAPSDSTGAPTGAPTGLVTMTIQLSPANSPTLPAGDIPLTLEDTISLTVEKFEELKEPTEGASRETVVTINPGNYTLGMTQFPTNKLTQPPEFFRNRTPVKEIGLDSITVLDIASSDGSILISADKPALGSSLDSARDLLTALHGLRVLTVISEAKPGERLFAGFQPAATIILSGKDRKFRVMISPESDEKALCLFGQDDGQLLAIVESKGRINVLEQVRNILAKTH